MQVSRGGYYAWKNNGKSRHQKENESLVPVVLEAHRVSRGSYGARRIAEEITEYGVQCGRYRARTLMDMAGVSAKQKKKFKVTTDSKHNLPVAPNLLSRNFETQAPNEVWVGDITYIWTCEGWLYLAVVLDLFSRKIVGWATSSRIKKDLVIEAITMATMRREVFPGLIFHSDRGSQYCSHKFQKELRRHGIISSMSRKGDCWDNAVAESFFGSLKTERVFDSTYITRGEARRDLFDYIEMFYNCRRRHSFINNKSPQKWEMEKAA
jgi:putative transposase